MENFNKPIVLKDDSSLDKKIELSKRRMSADELSKYERGSQGEKELLYHLNKSNIGMYIMRDINLSVDNMSAQIDFIVVTSHHCYFIECKNYNSDKIIIDSNGNFEIRNKHGNRYERKGIKSPLSQVKDQLTVFKRICLNNEEKVKQLLSKTRFNDYFKELVVFTNSENRIDNTKAPIDMKYKVLKADNIIRQIEYDSSHYNGIRLSQEDMIAIADFILSNNVDISNTSNVKADESFIDIIFNEIKTLFKNAFFVFLVVILYIIFMYYLTVVI